MTSSDLRTALGGIYRKVGPRECTCRVCDWRGSTNALAKAAHERSKRHIEAAKALADPRTAERKDRQ